MTGPARAVLSGTDVHLWTASLAGRDGRPAGTDAHERFLSPEERDRAERFHFARDRAQYVLARSLVRRCLSGYADLAPGEWEFESNAYGKPSVHHRLGLDLEFNLSHSHGMCLLGVTRGRAVGVDVERDDTRISLPGLVHRVMSASETEELRRLPAGEWKARFLEAWVFKEAYVKARGRGLSLPLRDVSVLFSGAGGGPRLVLGPSLADRPDRWRYGSVRMPAGFRAAVCVAGRADEPLRFVLREAPPP
ncbi:4'-phosphopantetheinyl transferase superfamily protein [Streptomyces sp. NPDC052077]|uniref:4'-phosphopantetheinyl transferase family protein n=1 Tax=Streptomyces sp. NPDC052077 TaxID=3154757 RepID=UPI00342ACB31